MKQFNPRLLIINFFIRKGVEPDMSFLVLFFRNLMMGENNELKKEL